MTKQNDLTKMTDKALSEYILNIRKSQQNAMKMKHANSFGRLEKMLEAAWREQDRRR